MMTVHVESFMKLEVHGVTRVVVADSDNPGNIIAQWRPHMMTCLSEDHGHK